MKHIFIFLLMTAITSIASPGYSVNIAGCQILPANNIWNTPIDSLPVSPDSALMINNIGENTGLHADFGSGLYEGAKIGIPITIVSSSQPLVTIDFEYDDESDPRPLPHPT